MVGDTFDIEPEGTKTDGSIPAEGKDAASAEAGPGAVGRGWWTRSWIGRHWRGELPLDKAFWINGFLVNVALGFLAWWLDHLFDYRYEFDVATTLFLLVFVSLFEKWLMAWGCLGNLSACLYESMPERLHGDVAFAVFAFTSAVLVWQIVGIWRSANFDDRPQLPDGRTVGPSFGQAVMLLLMVVWIAMWVWQSASPLEWLAVRVGFGPS